MQPFLLSWNFIPAHTKTGKNSLLEQVRLEMAFEKYSAKTRKPRWLIGKTLPEAKGCIVRKSKFVLSGAGCFVVFQNNFQRLSFFVFFGQAKRTTCSKKLDRMDNESRIPG